MLKPQEAFASWGFYLSNLPNLVFVRSGFHALSLEIPDHPIQLAAPHVLEPVGLAKPLYQSGADGVVQMDEQTAIPAGGQGVIAVPTQGPNLRTVVGTVNSGSYIAATG